MATSEEFVAWLEATREEFNEIDFSPVLERCINLVRAEVQQNFVTGTSPEGEHWPPRKDKLPHPLLIKTGLLFRSSTEEGFEDHIEEVSRNGAIFGTGLEYAGFHQEGTKYIPIRKFMGASPELLKKMEEIIADFLERKLLEMFDRAATGVS